MGDAINGTASLGLTQLVALPKSPIGTSFTEPKVTTSMHERSVGRAICDGHWERPIGFLNSEAQRRGEGSPERESLQYLYY